jgi:hypothetical protein
VSDPLCEEPGSGCHRRHHRHHHGHDGLYEVEELLEDIDDKLAHLGL